MEKKNEQNQAVENVTVLVDGKEVATEGTKKVGLFGKIGSAAANAGKTLWKHKGVVIGAAAGFGLKVLMDAVAEKRENAVEYIDEIPDETVDSIGDDDAI